MSSLYGSAQTATNQIPASVPATAQIATVAESSSTIQPTTNNLEAYLRVAYKDTPILVEVARCESNFHQFDAKGNIIRGIVNAGDVGVMQINEKYHADMAKKLGMDLYTVDGNIAYAKHLYAEQGTAPWSASAPCWSKSAAYEDLVASK